MDTFGYASLTLPNGKAYELSVDTSDPDVYHQAAASNGLSDTNSRFINRWIRPGDIFFDVGANIGTISIPAALAGATVHAFELLSSNVQHLLRSAQRNGISNLSVILAAVSDRHDAVGIGGTSAWGTVVKNAPLSIASIVLDDYAGSRNLQAIDLMKIDVEGSELVALHGARRIIEKYAPDIVIEGNVATSGNRDYSYRELLKHLEDLSYQIFRLHADRLCPWNNDDTQEVIFADYFATRKSPTEVAQRVGWPVAKLTRDEIIESIELQDLMGNLHKQYTFAIADKLQADVSGDPRVRALLEKWRPLESTEVRRILLAGSQ